MVNRLGHPFLGFRFFLNEFPPNLWVGVEPPGPRIPTEPALLIEKVLTFMEHVLDMLETVLDVGAVDPHTEPLADPGDDVLKGGGQEPALGGPVPDVLLVQQRVYEVLVHLLGPDHAVPAGGPGATSSIAAAGAQPVLGIADHPPNSARVPQTTPHPRSTQDSSYSTLLCTDSIHAGA